MRKGKATKMSSPTTKKLISLATGAAALTSLAAASIVGSLGAHAEPQQYRSPIFGFGSDTTQDVMNALGGFANGSTFTPLVTSAASGYKQIVNFDATIAGGSATARECIATKLGSPLILRPNGSTEGQKVLSRQAGGVWYSGLSITQAITDAGCNNSRNIAGLVDFARSSSGPRNASGTDLTFLPFGKDAMTFAVSKPNTGAGFAPEVDSLTKAELLSLYTNGVLIKGATVIIPCGIQSGSGTKSSWESKVGMSSTLENTGTTWCNGKGNGARVQENHGPDLKAKADAIVLLTDPICDGVAGGAPASCADVQVLAGFAASGWVSKSNGFSSPAPGAGVTLGKADGLDFVTFDNSQPSGSKWSPNSSGFSNAAWNRDVYNVVLTANLDPSTGDAAIIEMFKGSTSLICGAAGQAIVNQFGFLSLSTGCGSTVLQGGLVANSA